MAARVRAEEPDEVVVKPADPPQAAPAPAAPAFSAGAVLALQASAGNVATRALLSRAPLSAIDRERNLASPAFAGDRQLEAAFDENPVLGRDSRGEGVAKVQTALRDQGYALPKSFKTGKADGWYHDETFGVVSEFQYDHELTGTGKVDRDTMGKLDELAGGARSGPARPPEIDPTDAAMGKRVADEMRRVNDPSTYTASSGVWYSANYFAEHQKDPATFAWKEEWRDGYAPEQYWEKTGYYSWRLKPGKSAAEGLKAWLHGLTIAECFTAILAIEMWALLGSMGADEFDNRFGSAAKPVQDADRLVIHPARKGTPLGERIQWVDPQGRGGGEPGKRPVKVGDWVYFTNHPKYLLKHPGGAWQGENAVYMGDDAAGRQLFTGLGAAAKTEEAMLVEMAKAYNRERDADDYEELVRHFVPDAPEVKKPAPEYLARDYDHLRGLYLQYVDRIPDDWREDKGKYPATTTPQQILDEPESEIWGQKRKGGFTSASHKRIDAGKVT